MPNLPQYTISELSKRTSLFKKAPFQVISNGKVVAEVVVPGQTKWFPCESCGVDTQNKKQFKDDEGKWHSITLCDECQEKLL
jgi:NAD-dependent SIR2 family protein deacetylase